jgi:hypothetical protein
MISHSDTIDPFQRIWGEDMAHSNNVGQQAVPTRWPGAKGTHTIHSITEIPTQLEASHTSSCHSDRISASTPSVTRSQVMLPSSADNCRNERTMGTGAVGDGLDLGSDGPPPPDGGVDMRPDPIRGGQASMQVAECTPRSSPLDPDVESSGKCAVMQRVFAARAMSLMAPQNSWRCPVLSLPPTRRQRGQPTSLLLSKRHLVQVSQWDKC